ncbi:Rad3-related DNA helicase [Franzmannia pantelleriensis]|uniref:Rad3-related DNA helicase n=1 Tax=Franzmannia pantelleriensis TaxID=48727 RepID=A0A1G9RW80_9GAMM|nr:ATP-dependent DNA helicase [Halomonas pantelleriensis]SDM27277.1 Rad3-related DNA helicase [Halomonas pantelleriensis]
MSDAPVASPCYRVAVRALCDFTARAGDLDHRFTPSPTAQQGIEGHQLIAERRGAGYESELSLHGEVVVPGARLLVSGRADGFDPSAGRLEEVKTHRGSLARMGANQRALHWAQVKVYGALLCRARQLERVELALVYLDIDSGAETRFNEAATACELEAFFVDQCQRFLAWAEQEADHRRRRDTALAALRFPHADFRRGQRELAEVVYKAAGTGRQLLLQAPTGIGKTLGTLFPMLAAMPRQALDRVFFLTMKTPGRRLALEALRTLGVSGTPESALPLRVLELVARDTACEHPDKACHGDACPLAQGFYDRLPAARQAAVERGGVLDREALRELARTHAICPYYLGQELVRWCDLTVGDVNHYFDTSALLFAAAQAQEWRVAVLVDEAHNLVERARGMYSASLDQQRCNAVQRRAPPALARPLGRVARQWRALLAADSADQGVEDEAPRLLETLPGGLIQALQQAVSAVGDYLAEHPVGEADELQAFMFEALALCRLAESFDDHSICTLTRHGRGRATLALRNLIPADFLTPRLAASHTTVLFSATLSPADYYRDLLGLAPEAVWWEVASPFSGAQLEVRLARHLSTRWRDRDRSLDGLVAVIAEQYHRAPGNYLAFFSSFAYLESALTRLAHEYPEIPVRSQRRGMAETARQAFVDDFVAGGRGIGFAVLGGAFAEGIDLPGERLVGAFIATLGMPPISAENEILKARLDARFGRGFDYAYRYPGLTKVVQAAGRVIRGPEDRGVVVLLDDRFGEARNLALLPAWWQPDVASMSAAVARSEGAASRPAGRASPAGAPAHSRR